MRINSIPSRQEAETLLEWAGKLNPGLWTAHSKNAARSAEMIASHCGLDSETAFVMGLLHDIGRYEGITDLHHVIAGYNLMLEKGYMNIARICLTNSFPLKDTNSFSGNDDCTSDELSFLTQKLSEIQYDDYDKLIQFCDALASAKGIILIELRLMDVAKRRGVNAKSVEKWKSYDSLKEYFSKKCGFSVYKLFHEEICSNIL